MSKYDYLTQLKPHLDTYLEADHVALIEQAYLLAEEAHSEQMRRSGDPYISHPVAVATILATIHMDHQSIMAALLHDVLEDTSVSKETLIEKFGEPVADLVDGVSKLTQINFESRAEAQAENFRKMLLAMVRDIRVILVKLADRLHNMRTLDAMPLPARKRIARETLDIYAPIANRLGMHTFRVEFEELGFRALHPMRYRVLSSALKKARRNRKEIIHTIKKSLVECLAQHGLPNQHVVGREKHLYSIYNKMKAKHTSFSDIMDVYAFRIIVDTTDMCYRVLGAVHNLYKPVPERFKDYIAIPKANGYQSLHTTLFGPFGVPIEIQIRSEAMERMAENGIAAHWLYKAPGTAVDEAQVEARAWLKGLLELQQNTGNSLEFLENVKIDLFPDEVYVFTPDGDIMELPRGATPVDFAYAVHSDVGNGCVAAKINRRLAPLSATLMNGETVEIITAPGARPNPAWLNFVVTGKARSNIRHSLKNQQRAESIVLGRQLLERAFKYCAADKIELEKIAMKPLAKEFGYKSEDDLLEAIGLGNQVALVIARRLLHVGEDQHGKEKETVSADAQHPLVIRGTQGMVLTYAECCRPIPGDPIVGRLVAGRGVVVHTEQCEEVARFRHQPERFIYMRWEDQIKGEFKADIMIEVLNQRWVLAQIASAIADAEANIDDIHVDHGDGHHFVVHLTLLVRDRLHLARVMRRLRNLKVVIRLLREKS